MSNLTDRPAPSTAAIAIATAILAALGGYFVGQASALGLFSSSKGKKSWPNSYDVTIHPDSSDEELMKSLKGGHGKEEDEESGDEDKAGQKGELKSFEGDQEECKLVLVVRTELGMTKGICTLNTGLKAFARRRWYLWKHSLLTNPHS